MSASLEQLRAEHAREVVGRDLADLLARVAAATARTYPPDYSPAGVWDESAVEDALQSWTEERLLGQLNLSKLLAGARSIAALRAGLSRSFGQHLSAKRRRTSTTNLYGRIAKLLATDSTFRSVGTSSRAHQQLYTLSRNPIEAPSRKDLRSLVAHAFEFSDADLAVIRYGPLSLKSSPILRAPQLKRFVEHMLDRAAGALDPTTLISVMRRRFNLTEPTTVELDELMIGDTASLDTAIDERATAQSVVARLGRDRTRIVRELHLADGDVAAAGKRLDCDDRYVEAAIRDAVEMIAETAHDSAEATRVYGLVIESLFENDNDGRRQ